MKRKISQKLKVLATEEAEKLKMFATKEEISKLNLSTFEPDDRLNCIYGQMTGNCNSERANELIMNCAKRIYDTSEARNDCFIQCKLGGKPYSVFRFRINEFISPIELIIYRDITSGPKIINYLKGETKTLTL